MPRDCAPWCHRTGDAYQQNQQLSDSGRRNIVIDGYMHFKKPSLSRPTLWHLLVLFKAVPRDVIRRRGLPGERSSSSAAAAAPPSRPIQRRTSRAERGEPGQVENHTAPRPQDSTTDKDLEHGEEEEGKTFLFLFWSFE